MHEIRTRVHVNIESKLSSTKHGKTRFHVHKQKGLGLPVHENIKSFSLFGEEEIISFVGVRTHEKFYLQVVTRFENFPTRNLSENQPNPKPKSHFQFGEVDTKLVNNELHSLKTLKNLGGS